MLLINIFFLGLAIAVNATQYFECQIEDPIQSIESFYAISHCESIKGNLVIEDLDVPIIEFKRLREINGDLIIRNSPELVRVESPILGKISGSLKMNELTSLSLISFPSLKSVTGLDWRVIPLLSNVRFSSEISDVQDIIISDTSLTGFSGFRAEQLQTLDINNNRFLEVLNSNVENINGMLHIASNAKSLKLNIPKLRSVNNVSINDVEELDLSALTEVKESMSIYNNNFEELKLPNLERVGGTLSITKNSQLSTIELDNLEEINGGLMIINNTQIQKIEFLANLTKIDGGVELVGNFEAMYFNSLKLVKGSAKIKSSNSKFDCNKVIRDQLSLAFRGGKIDCSIVNGAERHNSLDDQEYSLKQKTSNAVKVLAKGWVHLLTFLWFL